MSAGAGDPHPVCQEAALHRLNEAIRTSVSRLIESADSAATIELEHLLAGTKQAHFVPGRIPRNNDAADRYLPQILAGPFVEPLSPVAASLATVWDRLDWYYHYADRGDAPGLACRVAFAELVGPDAPLAGRGIRMGFTLLAPDVLYPSHAHPASELYVVLCGRARWTKCEQSAWRDPGAVIVHASEEAHAMQTFTAPLLALYSWRGAIDEPARYL